MHQTQRWFLPDPDQRKSRKTFLFSHLHVFTWFHSHFFQQDNSVYLLILILCTVCIQCVCVGVCVGTDFEGTGGDGVSSVSTCPGAADVPRAFSLLHQVTVMSCDPLTLTDLPVWLQAWNSASTQQMLTPAPTLVLHRRSPPPSGSSFRHGNSRISWRNNRRADGNLRRWSLERKKRVKTFC